MISTLALPLLAMSLIYLLFVFDSVDPTLLLFFLLCEGSASFKQRDLPLEKQLLRNFP